MEDFGFDELFAKFNFVKGNEQGELAFCKNINEAN